MFSLHFHREICAWSNMNSAGCIPTFGEPTFKCAQKLWTRSLNRCLPGQSDVVYYGPELIMRYLLNAFIDTLQEPGAMQEILPVECFHRYPSVGGDCDLIIILPISIASYSELIAFESQPGRSSSYP
jgi:hypothetical protein